MLRRAHPWLPALLAAALAVLYLVWDPLAPDLAAQVFRTDLFAHDGFALWNGQWFGGHHTLGYSVLFPPLAAALGPELVGGLAVVASAVLFDRVARRHWGQDAWLGSLWFAASTATNLLIGRLTFAQYDPLCAPPGSDELLAVIGADHAAAPGEAQWLDHDGKGDFAGDSCRGSG